MKGVPFPEAVEKGRESRKAPTRITEAKPAVNAWAGVVRRFKWKFGMMAAIHERQIARSLYLLDLELSSLELSSRLGGSPSG
jgi:hypothetical protein